VLSGRAAPIAPQQNNNLAYDEDMGYRTMTREDAAIMQQQQINNTSTLSPQTPTTQNMPQCPPMNQQQTHHRNSRFVMA
jgi:hypothetical protein